MLLNGHDTMRYGSKTKTYACWEFPRVTPGWTLCLFDDHWHRAVFAAEAFDISQSADRQRLKRALGHSEYVNNLLAVALMPFYVSEHLPQVSTLYVADLPASEGDRDFADLLDKVLRTETAFLIDVLDDQRHALAGSTIVLPELLERRNVAPSRCAWYTFGGTDVPGEPPLEFIVKPVVVLNHGRPLADWWKGVQDSIEYDPFVRGELRSVHKVINVKEQLGDVPEFKRRLSVAARRYRYGVWEWVSSFLDNPSQLNDPGWLASLEYAWLCVKAFHACGQEPHFSYGAMRALAHGLGFTLPNARPVEVAETDSVGMSPGDKENTLFCHPKGCKLRGQRFQDIAQGIRDWLRLVETNRIGTARVSAVKLTRNSEGCTLTIQFSEPLDSAIFDGRGTGDVTTGYKSLVESLGGGSAGPGDRFTSVEFSWRCSRTT